MDEPVNPHVIRFYTRKEVEYYEIAGKRVPKPSLSSSIPSSGCLSRSPLVLRGDNLKPLPGMNKNVIVQFLGDSTRDSITVTNSMEINMCCDKCMVVITPDIPAASVFHIRVGFNCKKIERSLNYDKSFTSIKIDNFESKSNNNNNSINNKNTNNSSKNNNKNKINDEMDIQYQQQQQQQQQNNTVNNNVNNNNSSNNNNQYNGMSVNNIEPVDEASQMDLDSRNNNKSKNNNGFGSKVNLDFVEEIIDPNIPLPNLYNSNNNINQNSNNNNSNSSNNSEIQTYTFDSEDHIIWSNEIVVPIEVSKSSKRTNNQLANSTQGRDSSRKKRSKTTNNTTSTTATTTTTASTSKLSSSNSSIPIISQQQTQSSEFLQYLMNGDLESIKVYIETRLANEPKIVFDLEKKDEDGFSPLHYACAYGMNGLVEYFLKSKVDPNCIDKEGWTPLHWSVKANNLDAVQLLLEFGADQSVPNHSRQYPLEMAYDKGFTHIAATLQGVSESEFKKINEANENATLAIISSSTIGGDDSGQSNSGLSQEYRILLKNGLEPYTPPDGINLKSGVVEKHNTLKFIQAAEKLGLYPEHRSALMEAFKSLRTLRYRLFWIMLSNPLFSKICEWDLGGVDFLVHNKEVLLAALGLYFGLRGSNSAIDWMSHLARRKCHHKTFNGSGDVWTNLRASTFNSKTDLEKLKDITSEKSEKGTPNNSRSKLSSSTSSSTSSSPINSDINEDNIESIVENNNINNNSTGNIRESRNGRNKEKEREKENKENGSIKEGGTSSRRRDSLKSSNNNLPTTVRNIPFTNNNTNINENNLNNNNNGYNNSNGSTSSSGKGKKSKRSSSNNNNNDNNNGLNNENDNSFNNNNSNSFNNMQSEIVQTPSINLREPEIVQTSSTMKPSKQQIIEEIQPELIHNSSPQHLQQQIIQQPSSQQQQIIQQQQSQQIIQQQPQQQQQEQQQIMNSLTNEILQNNQQVINQMLQDEIVSPAGSLEVNAVNIIEQCEPSMKSIIPNMGESTHNLDNSDLAIDDQPPQSLLTAINNQTSQLLEHQLPQQQDLIVEHELNDEMDQHHHHIVTHEDIEEHHEHLEEIQEHHEIVNLNENHHIHQIHHTLTSSSPNHHHSTNTHNILEMSTDSTTASALVDHDEHFQY